MVGGWNPQIFFAGERQILFLSLWEYLGMIISCRMIPRSAIVLLALVVGANRQASADVVTDYDVAVQWGEIRTDGVRTPPNGHRFLNASGATTTSPSDAYFRFSVADLKNQLDTALGANNWFLSNIEIALTQSNFGGSTSGGVRLFHIQDDSVAITSGQAGDGPGDDFSGLDASTLVYGDWSTLSLANDGNPALNYTFTPTATGDIDNYGIADGLDISAMANWIESNDFLTFVLVADDETLATYKGNEFGGRLPPQIRFTATAIPEPGSAIALTAISLAYFSRRSRLKTIANP